MFLKRRVRKKDGKEHVYYALCESLRVHTGRVVQRQVLHLGELNTTQTASWQRTLEIINEEDGAPLQRPALRRPRWRGTGRCGRRGRGANFLAASARTAAFWRLLGGLPAVTRLGPG